MATLPSSRWLKLSLLGAMTGNALVVPLMGWLLSWAASPTFWLWYLSWCTLGGAWAWVQHRGIADRLISAEWSVVLGVVYSFSPVIPYLPFTWSTIGLILCGLVSVASFFQALVVEENRRARAEEARIGRREQAAAKVLRRPTPEERSALQRTPVTSIDLDEEVNKARRWRRAAMAKHAHAEG